MRRSYRVVIAQPGPGGDGQGDPGDPGERMMPRALRDAGFEVIDSAPALPGTARVLPSGTPGPRITEWLEQTLDAREAQLTG